jgi:TRAP-type mannitol/chloroaromatic compound transport system permease small subunit
MLAGGPTLSATQHLNSKLVYLAQQQRQQLQVQRCTQTHLALYTKLLMLYSSVSGVCAAFSAAICCTVGSKMPPPLLLLLLLLLLLAVGPFSASGVRSRASQPGA